MLLCVFYPCVNVPEVKLALRPKYLVRRLSQAIIDKLALLVSKVYAFLSVPCRLF